MPSYGVQLSWSLVREPKSGALGHGYDQFSRGVLDPVPWVSSLAPKIQTLWTFLEAANLDFRNAEIIFLEI